MRIGESRNFLDFYDRLKTVTRGYGSFDYEALDYRVTDIVKVDIMVNNAGMHLKEGPVAEFSGGGS